MNLEIERYEGELLELREKVQTIRHMRAMLDSQSKIKGT